MRNQLLTTSVCLLFLVGCGDSGPALAPVKGKVTVNGQPYSQAMVVFQPTAGGATGVGITDSNGDYKVWTAGKQGASLGSHKVSVTTVPDPAAASTSPSEMRSDDPAYEAQANSQQSDYTKAMKSKSKEPIPAKYNTNSDMRFTVESSGGEFNVDIVK